MSGVASVFRYTENPFGFGNYYNFAQSYFTPTLTSSIFNSESIKGINYTDFTNNIYNTMPFILPFTSFIKKARSWAGKQVSRAKDTLRAPSVGTSKIQNAEFWKSIGYNPAKGAKLAKEAAKGMAGKFLGLCATYVKNAIVRAGLGEYIRGNGCDIARIYKNNKNFKLISAKGIDLKKLPPGVILCYKAKESGHHPTAGHVGIAQGNGTEISDYITKYPKPCSYLLVPV